MDYAARFATGSMDHWETCLGVVERTGDQLRMQQLFDGVLCRRYLWAALRDLPAVMALLRMAAPSLPS
jgi:hypothetical protein